MLRKVLSLSVATVLCFSMAACGGKTEQPTDKETETEQTEDSKETEASAEEGQPSGTVKLAVGTDRLEWIESELVRFKEIQPDLEVEVIEIVSSADMYTKLTMMMQSPQTCPDIMAEDGFMINADAAAGYLLPLDDIVAADEDFKNFIPAIMDGGKAADGKQYGIPLSSDVQGIWYNKKLFEKVGIPVPWEPKNWDDILAAGEKLKAIDTPDFFPIFIWGSKTHPEETSMRTFQNFYYATGAELYDTEQNKWIIDKENLLKTYNFINDVYNVKKIGAPLSIVSQPAVWDLFSSDYQKNDKMAMLFSGSWECGTWAEGKQYAWPEALEVWDFAKLPTSDGQAPGHSTIAGGWTWTIPQNAPNKAGAAELLKFLSSQQVNLDYCLSTGDLGVRSDVVNQEEYQNMEMSVAKQASESLEFAHFRPSVEGYATLTSMYTEVIESIVMGTSTPEEAVRTFESETKRIIGEENVIVK